MRNKQKISEEIAYKIKNELNITANIVIKYIPEVKSKYIEGKKIKAKTKIKNNIAIITITDETFKTGRIWQTIAHEIRHVWQHYNWRPIKETLQNKKHHYNAEVDAYNFARDFARKHMQPHYTDKEMNKIINVLQKKLLHSSGEA